MNALTLKLKAVLLGCAVSRVELMLRAVDRLRADIAKADAALDAKRAANASAIRALVSANTVLDMRQARVQAVATAIGGVQ